MRFGRPIIIDTGVLISDAIRPQSVPATALERALRHHEVYACAETLSELEAVLMRSKFDRYASIVQRQAFLQGLTEHLKMVVVKEPTQECTEPKDDKFLALAWEVRAELIVASDPHLTCMHPWRLIPILPPAAFLVM